MMRTRAYILIILIGAGVLAGCSNIFTDIAEKGFYKAVLFEAKQELAQGNYTDAIDTINDNMTTEEKDQYAVRWVLAQAYFGACGMDAIQQLLDLGDLGTSTLFEIFLTEFSGTTATNQGYCDQGLLTTRTFGEAAARSNTQNYLMLFGGWAKLGVYTSVNGDANDDGTVDGGWDPCNNADLPQAQVDEMALAFGNFYQSLSAIIAGGDTSTSDLAVLDTLCTTILAIDPTYDICSAVTAADVTDPVRVVMRCLVDGSDVGFGISGNDIATCIDDAGGNAVCPP